VHELVPGDVSPEEKYSVIPLLVTSTLPSFVVAIPIVAFAAPAPDDGVGAAAGVDAATLVVGVAPGVVVDELALELLEQSANTIAASAARTTYRRLDRYLNTSLRWRTPALADYVTHPLRVHRVAAIEQAVSLTALLTLPKVGGQ